MQVYVCDAIMGSGKTTAAINYINEHYQEEKFIYITPFIDECARVVEACRIAGVVTPGRKSAPGAPGKVAHTKEFIRRGKSVVTTHAAFSLYDSEIMELISEQGYTLIMDEALCSIYQTSIYPIDFQMLVETGYLTVNEDGRVDLGERRYGRGAHNAFISAVQTHSVFVSGVDGPSGSIPFYWDIRPDIFRSFEKAFVLTYLFDGQDLKGYFDKNGIEYERIGVSNDGETYRFSRQDFYVPEYTASLSSKIHICDDPRLNKIGDGNGSLSSSWYHTNKKNCVADAKKFLRSFFRHDHSGVSVKKMLWATYADMYEHMFDKETKHNFLVFNARATNEWRDRTHLAYMVNLYNNPFKKNYVAQGGGALDDDAYALSTMVQWIWRSAIRDGEEIWVYVPSKRMRELLIGWITKVETTGRGVYGDERIPDAGGRDGDDHSDRADG